MQKNIIRIDWSLFFSMIILLFLGLTTLYSIQGVYFRSQIIFTVISVICFLLFSNVDLYFFKSISLPIYLSSLLFLTIILILGIESRGAMRWLEIIGLRIQFSEILKPFLSISFALFISENKPGIRSFIIILLLLFPLVFLLYRQPDLGNALLYTGVVLLALLVLRYPIKIFLALILSISIFIPIIFKFLHQYQKERLYTFFHFKSDPLGISYNVIQAVIAVGSGMFFGKGLGQGTQSGLRFLPERHTDFIFATLSEELGFIGSLIIIVCFFWLIYRIYNIAKNTTDSFSLAFAVCAFWFFFIQFIVNIGMNMGLLPIVGITLPFVSYGGSSLIASSIFLGLLVSLEKRKNTHILEII